eukprot:CAMPEP_0171521138 /NCGR_PEP_ID=MMETSP0959-20130129/6948_1 /TAXON_ID=87120 /ORGANISM="Aurantiochytrium limacinum, Strain ATCCMYA-1381" /LENGTH=117 /DNA_ID=CAMNT_0012060971 /DNA_START=55 /DNA_END=409 /DNA_ORIENTATION=+
MTANAITSDFLPTRQQAQAPFSLANVPDQVHIFAHALSLLCCFCSDSSRAINYIVDDHELQRRLHQIENIMRRKCDINKQHRSGRPSAVKTERQKKEQLEFRQHAKLKRLLDELDQY